MTEGIGQLEVLVRDEAFQALVRRILAGQCVLFVGAGASVGSGAPKTQELSDQVAERVLRAELRGLPLDEVVEYADGATGRPAVNKLIVELLSGLKPSESLLTLGSLPWAAAYSVNFDDLLEQALEAGNPGRYVSVYSARNLDSIRPDQLPLYMLHGSIRNPNDREMGLVLTQEDLVRAASQRAAFYRRLSADMQAQEMVYVGFSLSDSDFRRTVTELQDSIANQLQLMPRGYAVAPSPGGFAQRHWDTRKVTLIDATLEGFVEAVSKVRDGQTERPLIPVGARPALPSFLRQITPSSETGYEVTMTFDFPELDEGPTNEHIFLRGGLASWSTIRDGFDAARDVGEDVLSCLLVDPRTEPLRAGPGSVRVVLVTGPGGRGKTTLGRRLGWELSHNWGKRVAWSRNPGRLQLDVLESIATADDRTYVFVDDAADGATQIVATVERARRRGLRVTFVILERENEWVNATNQHPLEPDERFTLGQLSNAEAAEVIERLGRGGELGTLAGLSQDEQVARLVARAGRELLVAMREATEDKRFDSIVMDEYANLPTDASRKAYLCVSTLYQFGVPIRAGVMSRATGVPFDRFAPDILEPASGVIIEAQDAPWLEPSYTARHRVIADIVFRRALRSSVDRMMQVQLLLMNLDPGYRADARAYSRLTSARWLRGRGIDGTELEQIYSLAKRLRPGDPFVVQQEALSWRRRDRTTAERMLTEAARMAPENDAIKHSMATLLLDDAKASSGTEREVLLERAQEEFESIAARDPLNSAPIVSMAEIALLRADMADDAVTRLNHVASAKRILSRAFNGGMTTSYVLDMAGRVDEAAGDFEGAEEDYHRAALASADPLVWTSYASYVLNHSGPKNAASALSEALDRNPIDPTINYEYGRVLERIEPWDELAIRRAYELAVAEPVRGHLPQLDFGIFLFRQGDYDASDVQFRELRTASLPYKVKAKFRDWIRDASGSRSLLGMTIVQRGLRSSYLGCSLFPRQVFIHTDDLPNEARVGSELLAYVGFNCFGLRAELPQG